MMKGFLFTLNLLVLSLISFAQNEQGTGTIKGVITTTDNKPAVSTTVRLKGTKKATLTDREGALRIEN